MPRRRPDPRAGIIDGSNTAPFDIGYRIDLLNSMRDYFAEIYGNSELFFSVAEASNETLAEWCSRHIEFYNEACRLVNDCVAMGYIFDPQKISKLKDYHLEKAKTISSILMGRAAKRAKGAGAETPAG